MAKLTDLIMDMNAMSDSERVTKAVAGFTAAHRRNVAKAGPVLRDGVLGDVLAEVLESGQEPSRGALIAAVRVRIAQTQSARGLIAAEDDLLRPALEHALALLEGRNP